MKGYRISTMDGRSVLIRPAGSKGVQLCIISTYGNIMEAVGFNVCQWPSVLAAVERAGEEAERIGAKEAKKTKKRRVDRLAAVKAAANATHCPKGHELTPKNTYRRGAKRKGCRVCRREGNAWTREGGRLRLKTEAEKAGLT